MASESAVSLFHSRINKVPLPTHDMVRVFCRFIDRPPGGDEKLIILREGLASLVGNNPKTGFANRSFTVKTRFNTDWWRHRGVGQTRTTQSEPFRGTSPPRAAGETVEMGMQWNARRLVEKGSTKNSSSLGVEWGSDEIAVLNLSLFQLSNAVFLSF